MTEKKPNHDLVFEDHIDLIKHEISRRCHKWKLSESILYIAWEDVASETLVHIGKKWHLYKPELASLVNWLNRIISNQIKNKIRNVYSSSQCVCIRCPHNLGGSRCAVFGEQKSQECQEFMHWFKTKRYKQEIIFAQSSDAEIPGEENSLKRELEDKTCNFLDFETKIPEFQALLKQKLRPLEWKAYTYLFIDHLTDIQTAKCLGYDTTGGKQSGGYKNILKIKTKIYKVSQLIVAEMEF